MSPSASCHSRAVVQLAHRPPTAVDAPQQATGQGVDAVGVAMHHGQPPVPSGIAVSALQVVVPAPELLLAGGGQPDVYAGQRAARVVIEPQATGLGAQTGRAGS